MNAVNSSTTVRDKGITIDPVSYTHLDVYKRQTILLITFKTHSSHMVLRTFQNIGISVNSMLIFFHTYTTHTYECSYV